MYDFERFYEKIIMSVKLEIFFYGKLIIRNNTILRNRNNFDLRASLNKSMLAYSIYNFKVLLQDWRF